MGFLQDRVARKEAERENQARLAEEQRVRRPSVTVTGRPQTSPEAEGHFPRRQRLFALARESLRGHPLTGASAFGRPLGDGYGMEELVGAIEGIFDSEPSMIRWAALRGALAELWGCGPDGWRSFSEAVGMVNETNPVSGDSVWLLARRPEDMSFESEQSAQGVHAFVMMKVVDYDRIQGLSTDQVLEDRRCHVNRAMALDLIAWSGAVLLRGEALGKLPPVISEAPEPSQLDKPGWFVDPMFARAARYWDGTDWSNSCKTFAGEEFTMRIKPPSGF